MSLSVSLDSLLSGAAGSALSLVGAVIAAQLLIRHERRIRRDEAVRSEQAVLEAHISEAAVGLQVAASRLIAETNRVPFSIFGSARIQLLQAIGTLAAVTLTHHRAVADWALYVGPQSLDAANSIRKWWWVPFGWKSRANELGRLLGPVIAIMPSWAAGEVLDEWFASDLARRRGEIDDDPAAPDRRETRTVTSA